MMRTFLVFLICTFSIVSHTIAQDSIEHYKIPYINSGELLHQGRILHDSGSYKQAITLYNKVPEGDTNYSIALYEAAMSAAADSQYTRAKEYAMRGAKVPYSNRRDFMLLLADVYDYLGQSDSACMIYDSLIKYNPNDNQPYYEKGVVYFRQKKYDTAAHFFQESLLRNPYHYRSHFMLGDVYLLQGRLSEGLMAFEGAMISAVNENQARSVMQLISSITNETDEINGYYNKRSRKTADPAFDETDQIINAKLALNDGYKLQCSVKENAFKQMQVLMEKMSYDPADNNFAMQFYAPLLAKIYKDNMFEPYVLFMFSGYNIESVDKAAKAKKEAVDEAKAVVYHYFNDIRNKRILNYEKRKTAPIKYIIYDDGVQIVGVVKDFDKGVYAAGPIQAYHLGFPVTTGLYDDNGKKTGTWYSYYSSGVPRNVRHYKNDKEIGETIEYYQNGNISTISKYNDDGKEIEEADYNYKGILDSRTKLISENEAEVTSYYANGAEEGTYRTLNKVVKDGKYTTRYDNGRLKKQMEFKDGKLTGNYKFYYDNGQLEYDYNYVNGKKEGACTEYFENGKLKNKYTCHEDDMDGPYVAYYENGNLARKVTLHAGKLTGADSSYTEEGTEYATVMYKDDKPYYEKITDKAGDILIEKKDDDGLNKLVFYYDNGNKKSIIRLNEKSNKEGKCTFHYYTGAKSETSFYKDGKLNGLSTEYFKNGKPSLEEHYKDGERDGYYKAYYSNGVTKSEGWYKDGSKQGVWMYYYSNGNLSDKAFYLNDQYNGYLTDYNIAGEMNYREAYDRGMLCGIEQYDSTGRLTFSENYAKGNGHYKQKYKNGTTLFECNMKNGLFCGQYLKHNVTGKVIEKGFNINGDRDSSYINYFYSGKEHLVGQYKNGRKQGLWKSYNTLGALETEEHYKEDNDEGKYFYYVGGQPRYEYNYHNNQRDGEQYIYGEDKKIACVLLYKDGELVGYTGEGKDGKLLPITPIKNGTAKIVTYYPNGNKSAEFNYVENIRVGRQVSYFSNGQVADDNTYDNQMLQGTSETYYPNGKLYQRTTYRDDQEEGLQQVYDPNGKLVSEYNYYAGYKHGPARDIDPATKKTYNANYRYGILLSVK